MIISVLVMNYTLLTFMKRGMNRNRFPCFGCKDNAFFYNKQINRKEKWIYVRKRKKNEFFFCFFLTYSYLCTQKYMICKR